jgi:hypothetical protein
VDDACCSSPPTHPPTLFFFFYFKITTHPPTLKGNSDLRIRPGYISYGSYIQRQLKKTLDPKLRNIWTTRDWDRKIQVFADFFQVLKQKNLLLNESKALCIGARVKARGRGLTTRRRVRLGWYGPGAVSTTGCKG